MDNKFDLDVKKPEPQVVVSPKPVFKQPTTQEQISNLRAGGELKIAMNADTYNDLYNQFKPQRKSGVLRFEFNQDINVATIRNLKPNDTEL